MIYFNESLPFNKRNHRLALQIRKINNGTTNFILSSNQEIVKISKYDKTASPRHIYRYVL